jgi:hypothetical protein
MTAVANPPNFSQMSRPWPGGAQGLNSMSSGDLRAMVAPRKKTILPRSNSSSSISSISSTSSAATTISTHNAAVGSTPPLFGGSDLQNWSAPPPPKGRQQPPSPQQQQQQQQQQRNGWGPGKDDYARPNGARNGGTPIIGSGPMPPNGVGPSAQQQQQQPQSMMRPGAEMGAAPPQGQPVLYLLSMNGSFDRKTISVPFAPECVKIGRQTNAKTAPTALNGYFDSKVLSRQHAEIHADRQTGKVFIRDIKSSNGTFVNGMRLSPENRESEPHELATGDHLELGIDIINEDQKSIIHHKVAAKVEHAGWPTPSNSVLDMSFGDLDPANGSMMMPSAVQAQFRGRGGSTAAAAAMMQGAGRAPPGAMPQPAGPGAQRQLWMSQVTTEHIVRRLQTELRGARLQQQDLGRAAQLIHALGGSKTDIKTMDTKPEGEVPTSPPNGAGALAPPNKACFSEPPAPPPSQPLPEKPDVPGLKRAGTERPKIPNSPPAPVPPPENAIQITMLTEALSNAKVQFDSQSARVQELETMLVKERAARELAEAMAKKLEESALAAAAAADAEAAQLGAAPDASEKQADAAADLPLSPTSANLVATLQSRIETMSTEFCNIKAELEAWRKRSEVAEAARDTATQSLAQMVLQVKKDDEARRAAEERKSRSRSRRRSREKQEKETAKEDGQQQQQQQQQKPVSEKTPLGQATADAVRSEEAEQPSLSRTSTVTPASSTRLDRSRPNPTLIATLPYITMVGVVAVGVSLMAYLNQGWQPVAKPMQS